MKAVLQTIRLLITTLLIEAVLSQDGFERDLLRLHRLASEGSSDTISGYGTHLQRDPTSQNPSPVSPQYQLINEENEEFDRRGRSRKVYRIKNPFQRPEDENPQQQETQSGNQDSDGGASNHYAAMQYSLPPDEFLRQMRAENQYFQQQMSTPAPNPSYTATPQPQYQYSTIAASGYDNNTPQSNQIAQLEPKMSQIQDYRAISNSYQYNGPNSYVESVQSTPSPIPPYLSTSNNQYIGTPSSTYVSSSNPLYLSSPANVQFLSSSVSAVAAGTPDYNNKVTTTLGSNSLNYEVEMNKKMQIDHYDNAANGIRYPTSIQQQFQNEYPTSTAAPSSTPYPDPVRDAWQNNINSNALSKSLQEYSPYPRFSYYQKQQDSRTDQIDGETHRIGNMPAANNVYLNFVQPDYQALANLKSRTRESEQESNQSEVYSHGDYGWKLSDRKPAASQSQSAYTSVNFPRYQTLSPQSDGVAVSQMSFHMDTGKPQQNYEHISKSSSETADAQEFAKAAARAHENMKRQQYYANEYQLSFNSNNPAGGSSAGSSYYGNLNDRLRGKMFSDTSSPSSYLYSNGQPDLITASPYYFANARENVDEKPKLPFDHDKALKNIVPIDVSNVVQESQHKLPQVFDSSRYTLQSYNKDQEQSAKQNFKSISDQFYLDKNSAYGLNIKPRPEDGLSSDNFKMMESPSQYYTKPQEQYFGQTYSEPNKRYVESSSSSTNYAPQQSSSFSDSLQSSANIQQHGLQRPQSQNPTDIGSVLKFNDIPYRLTQNLPPETFRYNAGNYEPVGLPTPLPIRLNQNVGSHQIDVASSILNKLMQNKPSPLRPEIDPNVLSNINGFKIANPYNVDLKLVADMLGKGKPIVEDSHMLGLRDQYVKANNALKFDLSQLQQILLKADNPSSLAQLDGLGAYSSPYLDIYGSGRFPYTGVKYSRSQEEEETVIPIADASNNHPIGAVVEQDDPINAREVSTGAELTESEEDVGPEVKFKEDRQKHTFGPGHKPDRHRHPNSLLPGRHGFPRKYPKVGEPYPLLKPPPSHGPRGRNVHRPDRHSSRRRRPRRPRVAHVTKTENNFEAEPEDGSEGVSFLLRPPPIIADAKSDKEIADPEPSS